MSIHFVTIHPFDPWGDKFGGIETAVRSMLHHAPDDFELSLVGVTQEPGKRPVGRWSELDYRGRRVRFFPLFAVERPNRRTMVPLFLRFPWALRSSGLSFENVVTVYHRLEPLAFADVPASHNVLCVHGDPREITGPRSEVRWRYLPWLYRLMEARAVRKAQRLFVVSREGVDYFQNRYPEIKEAVSFLSTYYRDELFYQERDAGIQKIRSVFRKRFGLNETSKAILFAGRWEEQKNPLLALEAFAIVSSRDKDARLLLAGSGGLKPKMDASIEKLNLRDCIHVLGALSPIDLAETLQIADVFLLSSQFEGMPIGVLEALACGVPVVSTDVGEIRAIIENGRTGRIVERANAISLAEAILDILSNLSSYSRDACSRSVEPFRPASILPTFFDAMRSLV